MMLLTMVFYQEWDLDGLGNWTTNKHDSVGSAQQTETRTHSDFNEIDQSSGTPYAGGALATHSLDKNGNITDDGLRTLEWDALNRLKKVSRKSDGKIIGEYVYDCHNRRLKYWTGIKIRVNVHHVHGLWSSSRMGRPRDLKLGLKSSIRQKREEWVFSLINWVNDLSANS